MPEWIWLIALFVTASLAYFAGYVLGKNEADAAPTENAWINIRKYAIDMQKEVDIHELDNDLKYQLRILDAADKEDKDVET